MRLGVYGGSFDPIHRGHVAAAVAVRAQRGLDRVLLVPAGSPPHKDGCVASVEDRIAMARLAAADLPGLEVLDLEARRPPPSFTVDTIEALRAAHPGAELDLLVGSDMLEDLPRWHRAGDLVAQVTVVAFPRPGADAGAARRAFLQAFGPEAHLAWLEIPPVDASSTEVRRLIAEGRPAGALLDPAVEAFIAGKGLYKGGG